MKRIKYIYCYIILIGVWMFLKRFKNYQLILDDIIYWLACYHESIKVVQYHHLVKLCAHYPAFRNVLYFRLKKVATFLNILLPKQNEPIICSGGKIGGGLFFCHGFSTIVVVKSMGKNCWINQQVTIGANSQYGYPTIGNDVHIFAGALVIGDITIGNNVVIGAGTVVTKSVPDNCTVVGNPARIIRRNGVKVNESL